MGECLKTLLCILSTIDRVIFILVSFDPIFFINLLKQLEQLTRIIYMAFKIVADVQKLL